jgi:mono/diheme cytochrome c family protein
MHSRKSSGHAIRWATALFVIVGGALGEPVARVSAAEPDPVAIKFFETKVRPILADNCFKCHGPAKQKGGLRLDSRGAALQGGENGPAVVPGRRDDSLLVEAIHYESLEMPPAGKLDDAKIAILTRWVEMGAPWPTTEVSPAAAASGAKPRLSDEDRAYWAFQPIKRPEPPVPRDGRWSRNPIDRFILARLEAEGLTTAPEADRRTLIRRASFDLTGLPPTPTEIDAFVNDTEPLAYERLIERLLASPRYGERWARHWLDLVRYAESDGYRADAYRPETWRYRDYVIAAFNDDVSYDRFIAEQLAGDELAPGEPRLMVATTFLRLWIYEHNQRDVPEQWRTILNDLTDVTGDVFLGLGIGCARCHDHKYDPILQEDYYRLQAFFAPLLPRDDLPLATTEAWRDYEEKTNAWEAATAEIRAAIAAIERPYLEKAAKGAIDKFPKETQELLAKPESDRTPLEEQIYRLAYRQVLDEEEKPKVTKDDQKRLDSLKKELAALDHLKPAAIPTAFTATDVGPLAPPTRIPGDRLQRDIAPGFLTLLDPEPAKVTRPPTAANSTGRRAALARWLARPDNPLTARVFVNRLWQYHFGRGLVATSSDFGRLGERPSHPELLDWLASEFMARGWKLKSLHRLIMTSAAYRQAALRPVPALARLKDPENRLLWRMNTRRLEIEPIRDAMLCASGELDLAMGGPGVAVTEPRRTIYTKVMRNTRDPLLEAFDAPDGSNTTPTRNVTITPTQSLILINGGWTLGRAQALARRLERLEDDGPDCRIALAYRLVFGRAPAAAELAEAKAFLNGAATSAGFDVAVWTDFCHALLNSNEFLYVD